MNGQTLSITPRTNERLKIKVAYLPAWEGCEFKATLYDMEGPLYHARGPSAFAALSDLVLQTYHTFVTAPFVTNVEQVRDPLSIDRSESCPEA
jgi:hypothetical protein